MMRIKKFVPFLLMLFVLNSILCFSQNKESSSVKEVAITMDDLPIAGPARGLGYEQQKAIFDKLLSKFVKENVPIIGFVNGDQLMIDGKIDERKVSFLNDWLQKGFDLGNHTYSHKSANKISLEEYEKEILDNDKLLRPIIEGHGKQLKYFRHPFLNTGLSLETKFGIEKYLKNNGY